MNKQLLLKAQVKGYRRKDGVWVAAHDDGKGAAQVAAPAPAPKKKAYFRKPTLPTTPYGTHRTTQSKGIATKIAHHPQLGDNGQRVVVHQPSAPSEPETWQANDEVATFTPKGKRPKAICGVPFAPWKDAPKTDAGWAFIKGTMAVREPPLVVPAGKRAASGVLIEEPDGRVWIISPTNAFGGYQNSFPKGGTEPGLSLQQNAIKETWEESGLQIEITGVLGDFERTTSVARMYTARRVGGDPTTMGWETQAVRLVPKERLRELLNMKPDQAIVDTYLSRKKD
ncbi:NUDIX hydrolase [Salmonella enterica]|nr:NUDIX hydrolase [Salmonella enterica]